MSEFVPKLRVDIQIVPTVYQGKNAYLIKDNLGLIKEPLLLQGESLEILQLIDGQRNVRDIQYEIIRAHHNMFISIDVIQKFLADLDEVFILDSKRFHHERTKLISEYSQLAEREAFLAGNAYPEDENELKAYLSSFFQNEETIFESRPEKITGLVAPHIDLEVGKKIYTKAYAAIKDVACERVLLLGTGHNLRDYFFSLTEKNYKTPLGRTEVDTEWIRTLKQAGSGIVSPDDFAHRSEHSLEFQLLFLQYLFGADFALLPILCGSFHEVLESYSRPSEIPGVGVFLNDLRELMQKEPSTLVVAGVDFSHIGPKFGHSWPASTLLAEAKAHDTSLIKAICEGNLTAFWSEMQNVKDRYNVCGFSTLACLLELIPGFKGHLLGYDVWAEESTRSAVSFAAVALT